MFTCLVRQWAKGAICRFALSWFPGVYC